MTRSDNKPVPCPGSCDRAGDPVWCGPCKRSAAVALNDIDRLAIWLEQQTDGFSSRSPGSYVAMGGADHQSPSPVTDALDDAYSALVAFEGAWRRFQRYSPTRRSTPGRTAHDRSMTLAFLSRSLTSILLTPEMSPHVRIIMRWRTVLQHLARAHDERLQRPGRCPRCHLVNVLYTDPDARVIRCRSCPLDMTEEEYETEVVEHPDPAVVPESRRELGLPT